LIREFLSNVIFPLAPPSVVRRSLSQPRHFLSHPLHTAPPRVALRVLSSVIYILSPFFQSNLRHKREYFDDVTFTVPSCRCHLLTRRHRDITPPNTPQSHQRCRRRLQRDARESQDGSPRRRRIPARNHDENVPGMHTPAEPSARSLGQRRRRQLERENRPQPPQTPSPTNRSQAQAQVDVRKKKRSLRKWMSMVRDYS
jgi:hypothetical protein